MVDSGDALFGGPGSDLRIASLLVAAMNAMHYQAMALGELDLSAPIADLQACLQEASFPILSANVGPAGLLPVEPYVVVQASGHTVALVGVTSPGARQQGPILGTSLTIDDPVRAIQRTVQELQGQAEVIVVLSDLDGALNNRLASEVAGIDAILGLHGGGYSPASAVQGPAGTVVLQAPGKEGQGLGVLTLHFDAGGQVVDYQGEIRLLTPDYADDPAMLDLMRRYGAQP